MSNTTLSPLAAPTSPMNIRVSINDIQPFDNDPRRAPNEKYEIIRESIRMVGLQQQISITKRPHEDHYIVRSGGNTRLKVLKELHAETGEERFSVIECRFVPYTDEIELLSLHLMDNEQYARLLFIDSAKAVKAFKTMTEEETGEAITYRQLACEMKHQGWIIKEQDLPYYIYATEIADDMPIAFAHDIGLSYITYIRILEKRIAEWAHERNLDSNQCIQIFRAVLRKNDSKMYSITQIERDLFDGLSSTFKLSLDDVQNYFIPMQKNVTTENHGVTNNG